MITSSSIIYDLTDTTSSLEWCPPSIQASSEENERDSDTTVISKTDLRKPKMYKVIMHNDDYTTMEFVILVLKRFFNKVDEEAHAIMLLVHHEGHGVCGVFTHEIAESKVLKVNRFSREKGHPLKCSAEAE